MIVKESTTRKELSSMIVAGKLVEDIVSLDTYELWLEDKDIINLLKGQGIWSEAVKKKRLIILRWKGVSPISLR